MNEHKVDDGGSAFPWKEVWTDGVIERRTDKTGMSLRDWFAGAALQGIYTNSGIAEALIQKDGKIGDSAAAIFAEYAYLHADAMIAERNRQTEKEEAR